MAFNELMLNQAKALLRSVPRFLDTISSSLLEICKMLSLAKLHFKDNVTTKNKSSIIILKSKGPKIEP